METAGNRHFSNRLWLLAMVLVVATFAAYQSAWHAGFIWDDDDHLTANPVMTAPHGLQKIWSSMAASRYYPLTLTNFWLQRRLWGLNPLPYHLVNIALHAINGVLAFLLLRRLAPIRSGLRIRAAWWVAMLWAVHPVNVESVAWVTEMKNTQSGLFFFLALLCFLRVESTEQRHQTQSERGWYVLSLLCGAAAMLSKPSTVVLPLVLLLCTWWERERLRPKDIARVVPFFAMALAMSLWAISEQQHHVHAGGISESTLGIAERLIVAGRAVWFYAGKVLWPSNLVFVYPRWELKANSIADWLPLLGVVAAGTALWRWRRQPWAKACLFGFGFFVIALLPVLGFFDIYYFRYSFVADHFQYLANLGLVALVTSGVACATDRRASWAKPVAVSVGSLLLVTLVVLTWRQGRIYHDEDLLYRTIVQQNPRCWMAHDNLSVLRSRQGKLPEAIRHCEEALRSKPDDPIAHNSWGAILIKQGKIQEAIAHFEQALRVNPSYPEALNNMGNALLQEGKATEAIAHIEQSLRIRPDSVEAHSNLGNALLTAGKVKDAIAQYELALRIKPDHAEVRNNMGVALLQSGRPDVAIEQFEWVLRAQPDSAEAQRNWGHALEQMGITADAIRHYEAALRIRPDYAEAHTDLGNVLSQQGNMPGALEHHEQALRLKPDFAEAQNNLAWLLAILPAAAGGDPSRAVKLAERACALTSNRVAPYLDTLAAAYAAAYRFDDAIATAQKAIELARTAGQPEMVSEIEAHLKLYRSGQPYRQAAPK